ncbi:MAG TPA: hypothetical protein VFL83_02440 [Anaeromyxobacter sp.]|nr:hypothetical protein [Anaeromyxobacter sp.]
MHERRTNPLASGAANPLSRRLRALLESSDAPLPRQRSPRLDPVRRSGVAAAWQARAAVRAGMPLDDFLRARLARYLAELPVPGARLPVAIAVEDGQIACRVRAGAAPAPDAGGDAWIAPLVSADGPSARQEVAELEIRVAVLDGESDAARRRAEEIAHRFASDVAAGLVAAPPGVDATPEQMGRPPVRGPGPRGLMLAVAASALAAEAWQVAVPLLAGAGIDPEAVVAEAATRPGDVASLVLFALGVTASLFALAHGALSAGAALLAAELDPHRRRWLAGAGAAASALAALVAASVAALPRPTGADAPAGVALAILLLAVPVGAALVLRAAARLESARADELARALAWDRDRALALAERARRLEELRWAEDEQADLERQREAARRRLRDLSARAIALARQAAAAAEQERTGLARLAQGLVAALELDRYAYVRHAAARGVPELAARRRPPPDARAGLEPPTTGTVGVEAGRLAS